MQHLTSISISNNNNNYIFRIDTRRQKTMISNGNEQNRWVAMSNERTPS